MINSTSCRTGDVEPDGGRISKMMAGGLEGKKLTEAPDTGAETHGSAFSLSVSFFLHNT